jgi:selenocysteine-specific elongation factor
MKGFGTVVTGTVFSGSLNEDEPVQVLPEGLSSRARQLQSHNQKQERISAGMRAALNLAGIAVEQLKRGDTVVKPGTAAATNRFDAKVRLLRTAPRNLRRSTTVKLYSATSQQVSRMIVFGENEIAPGSEGYVQMRCQKPICIFRGDRFVIRAESPEVTIGGGIVLDVAPQRARVRKRERRAWLQELDGALPAELARAFLSKEEAAVSLHELAVRLGLPAAMVTELIASPIKEGQVLALGSGEDAVLIAQNRHDFLKERALKELADFFKEQPHRLYMPREQLRSRLSGNLDAPLFERIISDLAESERVQVTREGLSLAGRRAGITQAQKSIKEQVEKIYLEAGYSPPTLMQAEEQAGDPAAAKKMISLLLEEGVLQKISPTLAYHKEFLESALKKIRVHFQTEQRLAVGDLKTVLGVSRKHAVPLLEYFDRIGLTARVGDYRVLKEKARA